MSGAAPNVEAPRASTEEAAAAPVSPKVDGDRVPEEPQETPVAQVDAVHDPIPAEPSPSHPSPGERFARFWLTDLDGK